MAKNEVTLTFAGDSSQLERSFDRVGSSASQMGRSVDQENARLERLGETGGTTETRFLGLGAGISGVSTLMSGDAGPEDYAMAMADLGDAVEHTVAPLLAQGRQLLATGANAVVSAGQHVASAARIVAAWVLMGIQATINAAKMAVAWLISLGPIGLLIAAVGAVIGILVALGVGFDDVANVAKAAWDFILGLVQGFLGWLSANWPTVLAILTGPIGLAVLVIKGHWDSLVGFVTGLPGRIASAAVGMWDGITSAFKSAINALIRMWNDFEISFGGYDIPGPGPNIPGFTIKTPNIPYLHTGGVFQAPGGKREGLAMLLDGERVSRPGAPAGTVVHVYVQGSIRSDRDLVAIIRDELNRGGFS